MLVFTITLKQVSVWVMSTSDDISAHRLEKVLVLRDLVPLDPGPPRPSPPVPQGVQIASPEHLEIVNDAEVWLIDVGFPLYSLHLPATADE